MTVVQSWLVLFIFNLSLSLTRDCRVDNRRGVCVRDGGCCRSFGQELSQIATIRPDAFDYGCQDDEICCEQTKPERRICDLCSSVKKRRQFYPPETFCWNLVLSENGQTLASGSLISRNHLLVANFDAANVPENSLIEAVITHAATGTTILQILDQDCGKGGENCVICRPPHYLHIDNEKKGAAERILQVLENSK